ncbi:MAG TPA: ABC transporter ATP-binding protein [Egicoccus sp.]|nr:ABC transporter ATP-binding protein [Egicoccus sp.]HSK25122.1 ABC transporter ATP-binding protein [Egicoccus sp.]
MTSNGRPMPLLDVDGLRHVYGSGPGAHLAIENLDFEVRDGEFVSIVGPSGAGKTTLLKCTSGLMAPSAGQVSLAGEVHDGVPDDLALVFQDYKSSLFPWMTVTGNVDFPLGQRGLDRDERRTRIEESLAAVDLSTYGDFYPWQLSGGMQQRVAIARALAYRPKVLLMDEPFASVDAQTRAELEDLVLAVRDRFDMTVLFVTHDIDESVYLSDRILVLSKSPATIIASIDVPLPKPRDQIDTRERDDFVHLRAEIARLIRRAGEGYRGEDARVPAGSEGG